MEKRSGEFYVKTDSKVVQTIGKSYVMQPQICFKGGSIKQTILQEIIHRISSQKTLNFYANQAIWRT